MLIAPAAALFNGAPELLALVPFGIGFGALAFWIAHQIYQFECWTWFLLAGLVGRVLLAVPSLDEFDVSRGAIAVSAVVLCGPVHYLWKRRYDFWFESDAVWRQLDFERNGHRWARRSWKDDARVLKQRMAEREVRGRPSSATRGPSSETAAVRRPRMDADEPLRGAGRAG